jgi:hypothetical protein
MVPVFRSLNLILSFPRLLENATAAIEPDFGRLFGPRLGSSRDITLQGVVRQKAGRPLWGRTRAGVFGIDRPIGGMPAINGFARQCSILFSNARTCSDGASAAGLRSRQSLNHRSFRRVGIGAPVHQNDNVSFTMSDKSLASFSQTPSPLMLAYTFAA